MPPNGIPASLSLRWKKIASSTGSCRGEVTIRNVVAGSSSSAPTRSARSVKPSIIPPSERKNTDRSSQQVDARDPLQQREHHAGAAPDDLAADPRRPQEHPDRAALEEAGQPPRRVEEVERVARRRRVEHEQVVVALLVELEQLRDRGELLRAGDRARELLVDPVLEDLLARRVVRREPLDHLVERALGVEHHRPQLARRDRGRPGAARCRARPSPARSQAAWPGRSSPPRPSSRARPSPAPRRPTSWSCRRLPTPRR